MTTLHRRPCRTGAWGLICIGTVWFSGASAAAQQAGAAVRIDLNQAIQLAIAHNHALKAARTQIDQSRAEEITAAIRPNPVFIADGQPGLPIIPSQFNSNNLNNVSEFDTGATFTWERGRKRSARIHAARDQTAVTRYQVDDAERALVYNVSQQFIQVLLAESNLEFAKQDLASFQQTVVL